MITISVDIDESDLDLFSRIQIAGQAKLKANGVHLSPEAHKRTVLSRALKNGLQQEAEHLLPRSPRDVATIANICHLFNSTQGQG